jgi:hypothetical protein
MRTYTILILTTLGLLLGPQEASASETTPVWDDSTRLALAQCLVAEAGWRNRTEHSAISHVLLRRWQSIRETRGAYRFETTIRRYCSVHRVRRPSSRQAWVRALPWGPLVSDPGMPSVVDWRNYAPAWDHVRETVALFEAGRLTDPLPQAEHWGGSMDRTPAGGVLLTRTVRSIEDGAQLRLHNRFYRVDREAARRQRLQRAAQQEEEQRRGTVAAADIIRS